MLIRIFDNGLENNYGYSEEVVGYTNEKLTKEQCKNLAELDLLLNTSYSKCKYKSKKCRKTSYDSHIKNMQDGLKLKKEMKIFNDKMIEEIDKRQEQRLSKLAEKLNIPVEEMRKIVNNKLENSQLYDVYQTNELNK